VNRSTGFAPPAPPRQPDPAMSRIVDAALPFYDRLAAHALT
jgi:hypothetical protein